MFEFLDLIEDGIWTYFGVPAIVVIGLLFTIKGRCFQISKCPKIFRVFTGMMGRAESSDGVHPLKAFFASVGGCIGIGNVVAVCTAVQVGGPGALVWLWIAGLFGMLVKYGEIYLGMKHRVVAPGGGFRGGSMYYLQKAFGGRAIAYVVCGLLCIYGVEVYMFRVITDSISINLDVNRLYIAALLLPMVVGAAAGGVQRVGNICAAVIPLFLVIFSGMSLWVLAMNLSEIPAAFATIFQSAFTGHAPIGAFAGSSVMMAASQGVRRACYTGDIGVGYASVIHSESSETKPEKQACLGIFGIYLDTFLICTLSILLIIVTGVWSQPIDASMMIQEVLGMYFPAMWLFMPLLIFLLGYSSMISFLVVGMKSAEFLAPVWGRALFLLYAISAFITFTFVETGVALTVMSLALALLLCLNLAGIFLLRDEIEFRVGN